jgi:lipopolysaccharide export system permease protein
MGAVVEASRSGLAPLTIVRLLPYLIAPSLPFTIPCSLLLAVTYVFGTMSGNNEIVALKAGGVNVLTLIRPVVLLGLLVCMTSVFLSDRVIPWCQARLRMTLLDDVESTLLAYLRQKSCLTGPSFPYEVYVQRIEGSRLIEPIIKHRKDDGGYGIVISAKEATLEIASSETGGPMEIVMRMIDGVLSTEPGNSAYFRDRTERMPVPDLVKTDRVAVADQDFRGLDAQHRRFLDEERAAWYEASLVAACGQLNGDPLAAVDMGTDAVEKAEMAGSLAYRSLCEKHQRISRSTSAVPFLLLACPISILYQRREIIRTFFVCFLPIVTLYYPSMILCFNLLKESRSEHFSFLWLPSIAMCLVALPFLRRVVRQ